jgi:hypothetical protein
VHGATLDIKDIDHRLNSEHECTPLRLPRTMAVHGYLSLHAFKQLWTHEKADYGLQEEHWSQKSHFGTWSDSAGRMDSGPMFQTRTHTHQYQYVIMQAI